MTTDLVDTTVSPLPETNSSRQRLFRIEMERLRTAFQNQRMTPQDWKFLMGSMWVILDKIQISDIQYGVRKILESSKFFPSPAELLEACRNPFEDRKASKPAFKDDLPAALPEHVRKAMIDRAEVAGGFVKKATGERTLAEIKAEILARPRLEMTPELIAREKSLAEERAKNLDRRLVAKTW